MRRKRYHSDFVLQYKLGLLSSIQIKPIPTSTRHYWRKTNYSSLIGKEYGVLDRKSNVEMLKLIITNKKLIKIAKALFYIILVYQYINKPSVNRQEHIKRKIVEVIDKCSPLIGLERSVRFWNISLARYYYWRSSIPCIRSPFQQCFKRHSSQLSKIEVGVIKGFMSSNLYMHWSSASIYYQILRNKEAFMSLSTFYKYVKQLGLKRTKFKKPKQKDGLIAEYPLQYLHMDVTQYRLLNNQRAFIYVLIDNFSRKILSLTASTIYSSKICLDNLLAGLEKIKEVKFQSNVVVDGGIENQGRVSEFLNNTPNLQKIIAKKDISFSNSMVEAVNKKIKYDYLFIATIENMVALKKQLPFIMEDYNARPIRALNGLTPCEAFYGEVPIPNRFEKQIKAQRQLRVAINSKDHCDTC